MSRFRMACVLVCSINLISLPVIAQQSTSTSPQPTTLLQNSLAVLAGKQSITDVTLTGSVRRIAGSVDESGSVVLKALASGAGRIDLNLPSGVSSETSNALAALPTGAWSGADSVSHAVPLHNLLTEPAWFFTPFVIGHRLSAAGYVAAYIGHETLGTQAVEHVSVSQVASADSGGTLTQHLSQVDFFLDSTTLLPAAVAFNTHPDNNALLDIPVQIQFSDYRPLNGVQIPFHIQKFLNNSLFLDFQIQAVALNSGLSASTFSAL